MQQTITRPSWSSSNSCSLKTIGGRTKNTCFVHCFGRIVAISAARAPNTLSVLPAVDNDYSLVIMLDNSSRTSLASGDGHRILTNITDSATARAHSNIAFVKYWGNRDQSLRLPANASISMNLAELHTTTTVEWNNELRADTLTINGAVANETARTRVEKHLDALRARLGAARFAHVDSRNNFPMGTGIASSASAFAAMTTAACAALNATISKHELSILSRLGSGSAARSIPSGFVKWHTGDSHETSYAESFAPADHWKLVDLIAIVSREHKRIGSSDGHETAASSIFQPVRVATAEERIASVKSAILRRDFQSFAETVEDDSNLMHAVMMTSKPPLFYWEPLSLAIMEGVRRWRQDENLMVCYTLDAGPNVHCICANGDADAVATRLRELCGDIDIIRSGVGCGAYVLPIEKGQPEA